MKKMLRFLSLAGLFVFAVGCSNAHHAADVAQKIQNGSKLDEGDWTTVIEYLGDYAAQAQTLQDVIDNEPAGSRAAQDASHKLSELTMDHEYLNLFSHALNSATAAQVGADNVSLVDKYSEYIWFTAPSWAIVQPDPQIAGEEVEVPRDSGSVIANSVEETKVSH